MANQPTPPNNHWFPLIRPAFKPLFLGGVRWGGWLTSYAYTNTEWYHPPKKKKGIQQHTTPFCPAYHQPSV